MGTITSRGERHTARVRMRGAPNMTRTFATRDQASAWIIATEETLSAMVRSGKPISVREIDPEVRHILADLRKAKLVDFRPDCGVYFLFKGASCIYVGQSVDIQARIAEHRRDKDFDIWSWMPADPDRLDETEALFIATLRPPLNHCYSGSGATKVLQSLKCP